MNKFKISVCFVWLFCWHAQLHAAIFCVTTTQQLNDALASADSNNQDDEIRISVGNYGGGYYYNGDENFDLTISGGWTAFFDNPCFFSGVSAYDTVLDGDGIERVMNIEYFGSSKVHISHLTFINGDSSPAHAGGLRVWTTNPNLLGNVLIENTAFINNTGAFTAAMSVVGGDRTTVRNSLFVANNANHPAQGSIIDINNNNGHGIYFNNNTVINNTVNGTKIKSGFRLVANGSGAFVANNILWNNEGADLRFLGQPTDSFLLNNNIEEIIGGEFDSAANNFSIEPQFESGFLNFQPTLSSVEINRGRKPPVFIPVPTPFGFEWDLGDFDVQGELRVQDGRVEIGAFEAAPEVPIFANGFQ